MNFQIMTKQRKFTLIAAAAGIIAVFLPWATVSIGILGDQSVNGFHSYGIGAFIGFVAAAVVALLGSHTTPFDKTRWMLSLITGVIALLFIVIFIGNISNAVGGGFGMISVGMGIGIWIALAAALAIVTFGWLFKSPDDTLKGAFDSLKKDIAMATSSGSTPGASGLISGTFGSTSGISGLTSGISGTTSGSPANIPEKTNSTGVITNGISDKIAELERLSKLRDTGSITEDEYKQLKSKIL
jgi:hypothetical protein